MYRVSIKSDFSSAHNLREYQGKCEHLHGHNWIVEAILCSNELDKTGMVEDFKLFKMALKVILERLDHKYLNEIEPFTTVNPTAENIAKFIFDELAKSYREKMETVHVWESADSRATYSII